MNKSDLIAAVADDANLSREDARKAVDAIFDTLTKALADGQEIRLVGFGSFSVSHRAGRLGRNPATGAPVQIRASRRPRFRASKALRAGLEGDEVTDP